MSEMFSVIASKMDAEAERLEGNRARIAATKRLERRFLAYLKKAESPDELTQRMAMVEKPARKIVAAACTEHRYSNADEMYTQVTAELLKQADSWTNPGDGGDTYQQERESLPAADASGLGSEGSPEIDKSRVPEGGLDAIDVHSERHPLDHQNVKDGPDYDNLRHDGPEVADPTGGPRVQVDADKPMQPEFTNGDTNGPQNATWSDKSTQADPVTSHVEAKWDVLDQ